MLGKYSVRPPIYRLVTNPRCFKTPLQYKHHDKIDGIHNSSTYKNDILGFMPSDHSSRVS